MGRAIPFSKIGEEIFNDEVKGIIADTNFLIAIMYEPHHYHEVSVKLFDCLVDLAVPIYVNLAARSEYLDFQRRMLMTEALMDMLGVSTRWKITNAAKIELRRHRLWIDTQASKEDIPILTDHRLKECKKIFIPRTESGKNGWQEICASYLDSLKEEWEKLVDLLGLRYIGVRETDDQALFSTPIRWERFYEISGKTCLSSSDSLITNVLTSSNIPVLASTDYDLAYAILAEQSNKTVLIPDSLYERHIKGLRFSKRSN